MVDPRKLSLKRLLADVGVGWNSDDMHATASRWRSIYWLYAAIIPAMIYSLEAIKISLYHVSRAPNVNLLTQLMIMLIFYGLWTLAPRLIWAQMTGRNNGMDRTWGKNLLRVSGIGLFLSGAHLLLLTFLLLLMHATASWAWEPIHILHAFGETWLGYAGMWLMGYAMAAAVILYFLNQRRDPPPARYEVRENGKTLSIPITDIYWVKAAGNYVELHTVRGVMMIRKTLSQIDKEIGACGFLKSHRSALVNGHHVLAIRPQEESGGFTIQLTNGEEAPLSRRKLSEFKEILRTVR